MIPRWDLKGFTVKHNIERFNQTFISPKKDMIGVQRVKVIFNFYNLPINRRIGESKFSIKKCHIYIPAIRTLLL